MKLLLDSCVWGGVLQSLREAGHNVVWCGEWDRDPGDAEILAHAYREERILATLDKDFGDCPGAGNAPYRNYSLGRISR
jgi:predicted nuclease of predicted toxin-antitoxin system